MKIKDLDKEKYKDVLFIMLVGFSKSGKSSLSKKIARSFSGKITRVDADMIHDFLNESYPIFKDDNTISGNSFEIRQRSTYVIREAMIDVLISHGYSVLLDSCNLSVEKRRERLTRVRKSNPKVKTVIIYNKISRAELYRNLEKADQKNVKNGEKPAWMDLYEKIQKPAFEEPTKDESDYFIIYDKTNYDKVKSKIEKAFRDIEK